MQFAIPTTKAEMYAVLQELFANYRTSRLEYDQVEFEELTLVRKSYTPQSSEEITSTAETLLFPTQKKREMDYIFALEKENKSLLAEAEGLEYEEEERIKKVEETFIGQKKNLDKQALKSGVNSSSIYAEKLNEILKEKNENVAKIHVEIQNKTQLIEDKIQANEELIENAGEYFSALCQSEIEAKVYELQKEQESVIEKVNEYNNKIEETEIKYANSKLQANANLKLKYAEINAVELSKSQLIELGYYKDIIRCICGYYDSLPAHTAYSDFLNEHDLAIYLEDYYQNILYAYKLKDS